APADLPDIPASDGSRHGPAGGACGKSGGRGSFGVAWTHLFSVASRPHRQGSNEPSRRGGGRGGPVVFGDGGPPRRGGGRWRRRGTPVGARNPAGRPCEEDERRGGDGGLVPLALAAPPSCVGPAHSPGETDTRPTDFGDTGTRP